MAVLKEKNLDKKLTICYTTIQVKGEGTGHNIRRQDDHKIRRYE